VIPAPKATFTFSSEDLKRLLEPRDPPCVSIYLPTHRRKTEGRSDLILFRNLSREAERVLDRDMPGGVAREIKERLGAFDKEEFWDDGQRSDSLGVFVAQGFSVCYRLPSQFPELNVVGATFHTKPLIRFLQSSAPTYRLLAVNADRFALYEGHGDSIHEVPLTGIAQALAEAGVTTNETPQASRRERDRLHYGQGGAKDQAKVDLEKLFRAVARDLWKNHLRTSDKPLILAAPGHEQPIFRRVAQIPVLLEEGITTDPSKMSLDDLKVEARRLLEPELARRIARVKDEFALAKSRSHGSDVLKLVAQAVVTGRVKKLIVESGRRIWGLLDTTSGDILPGDPARNAYDVDLLDELAEQTIAHGGEVYVLSKADMPTAHGLAAVFRF